jgi:hypothetical protein
LLPELWCGQESDFLKNLPVASAFTSKRVLITVSLLLQFLVIKAQSNEFEKALKIFQTTSNYDSIIINGEYLLQYLPFDETQQGKSFYSYLLNKLSLAYSEYNLLEKSDTLYSRFLIDQQHLDLKSSHIIRFLDHLVQVSIIHGQINKASTYYSLADKLTRNYHDNDPDVKSIINRSNIEIRIAQNTSGIDSLCFSFRDQVSTKVSASEYITACVSSTSYLLYKFQKYDLVESLLIDAIKLDSAYDLFPSRKDQIQDQLFSLYTETYQAEKLIGFIFKKVDNLKFAIASNKVDFLDLLSLSKYATAVESLNNYSSKEILISELFELFINNVKYVSEDYGTQLAIAYEGFGLALENSNYQLAKQAYDLSLNLVIELDLRDEYSIDILINSSRIYCDRSRLDIKLKKIFLDSAFLLVKRAIEISRSKFGENSLNYYKTLEGLEYYFYWSGQSKSSLDLIDYLIIKPCSEGILPASNCRGHLQTAYYGYLEKRDTTAAIRFLKNWLSEWMSYIFSNIANLLPTYEYNVILRDKIEFFNGEVVRNRFCDLYPIVYSNLLMFKYFQLNSILKLRSIGISSIDSLSRLDMSNLLFAEKSRLSISSNSLLLQSSDQYMQLMSALGENEISVEILKSNYVDYKNTDKRQDYYYALLVGGKSKKIQVVELAPVSEILDRFKSVGESKIHGEDYELLYGVSDKGLANLILSPILPYLRGYHTVYLSSYGVLSKVNYNILPISEGVLFEDKYEIHNVFSTYDIAKNKNQRFDISKIRRAILYGGIDYNNSKDAEVKGKKKPKSQKSLYQSRTGIEYWYSLPETEKEISSIAKAFSHASFDTIVLRGAYATESSLDSLSNNKSLQIIHIATHGYSLDNVQNNKSTNSDLLLYNDPLDLCGILLSGSNTMWSNGITPTLNPVDGILTASEIGKHDLRSSKLVVLSACETGLGYLNVNDGIFGLQRGLKLAGAQNSITSLWRVPDKSTREHFEIFYKFLLEGKSIASSLYLSRVEMRKKYKSPYYWGAFKLVE